MARRADTPPFGVLDGNRGGVSTATPVSDRSRDGQPPGPMAFFGTRKRVSNLMQDHLLNLIFATGG